MLKQAFGLLTSSLTDNQIIAAVSCLVALLLLYVISWPADNAGAGMVPAQTGIRKEPPMSCTTKCWRVGLAAVVVLALLGFFSAMGPRW